MTSTDAIAIHTSCLSALAAQDRQFDLALSAREAVEDARRLEMLIAGCCEDARRACRSITGGRS